MKTLVYLVKGGFVILSISFSVCVLLAQEQSDPYKKSPVPPQKAADPSKEEYDVPKIRIIAEWIDVDASEIMQLMREDISSKDQERIRKIRELESQGKATVIDTKSLTILSGEKAKITGRKQIHSGFQSVYPTKDDNMSTGAKSSQEKNTPAGADGIISPIEETYVIEGELEATGSIFPDYKTLDITFNAKSNIVEGWQDIGNIYVDGKPGPLITKPLIITSELASRVRMASGETCIGAITNVQKNDGTTDLTKKRLLLVQGLVLQ